MTPRPAAYASSVTIDRCRVLITTDTVGGVWNYTIELARALKAAGVTPFIAALGNPSRALPPDYGGLPVFRHACRLEWMQNSREDVRRSGKWLLRLADHLKPDVVHLNGYTHAANPFRAPVLVVGHSCVFSWHWAVKGCAPSATWDPYRKAVTAGLAAARVVTAPTAAMLEELRRHYGDFRRIAPIANGRRAADFPRGRKEPLIFSAGRLWDEAKNVEPLATAAGRLPWPVVLAGEHRHPEGGQKHFENVTFLGFLSQLQFSAWLSRAAVYALPALYEPFGLTVLEAGLAGCALVLGDIPSLRETWDDAAVFVSPRRADLLEKELSRLIGDERLLRHYALKARKRALNFTVEKMASRYKALYAALAGHEDKSAAPLQRAPGGLS